MTPGARAAAAISLIDQLNRENAAPADKVLADWARKNRYAGSKDRQAVAGMVYGVLRRRAQTDWWLARVGADISPANLARLRLLVWLQRDEGWTLQDIDAAFTGSGYAPEALSPQEKRILIEMGPIGAGPSGDMSHDCQPWQVRANMPDWVAERMAALYGEDADREGSAYLDEGPVDLRANTLKTDRDSLREILREEGVVAKPTAHSPTGLRLSVRKPLSGLSSFKDGLFEPQDEGSQLAAGLCDARPGMKLVDFCAGAGGKSLALAAAMRNKGRIIACDVSNARLNRAAQRLKRAGAFIVERRHLTSERDKWVKRRAGRFDGGFDRVLVDAPCSGSGTWRRNPDQKWRLGVEALDELQEKQRNILESAARLVTPGGRLIYVTCSFFAEENEAQIERFLTERQDFFVHPVKDVWCDVYPEIGFPSNDEPYLRLTPHRHGTDGFFVAILGRKL